jgi:hypothetical protein
MSDANTQVGPLQTCERSERFNNRPAFAIGVPSGIKALCSYDGLKRGHSPEPPNYPNRKQRLGTQGIESVKGRQWLNNLAMIVNLSPIFPALHDDGRHVYHRLPGQLEVPSMAWRLPSVIIG